MATLTERWTAAMRAGRYAEAWDISDAVLAARDPAARDDPALDYHRRWVWDGRSFDGQDVLVRCYHGLGDTIQFARFLPLLAERAASLTLEVQPCLAAMMAQLPGIDRIVPFDPARPLPPSACDLEIMELAHALRVPSDAVPTPYLAAPPADLPAGSIGLCYRAGGWDPARDLPPDLLHALCAAGPCVSLVPEPTTLAVANPAGCSLDVAESAALLAGVALVITIDTMIAHLAGALGRPTWLLLKAEPDWRWPAADGPSAWYPLMRTFRQAQPGDWRAPLARIEQALLSRSAG